MRIRVSFLALLLFVAASFAVAEDAKRPPSQAEAVTLAKAWLDAQRSYESIPGMSYAVVRGEDRVMSGGSGLADPAAKRAADADTLYSICSVSKLFTSIAVMQLRDEGKLSLEEPISKYLPWFTIPPGSDGGIVTLANMLSHSSGLPRESDYPYWSGNFDFPTSEQVHERIKAQAMLYPSDTYFQYSNLGLTLAGEVVSAVAKQPYADVVQKRILDPLSLSATSPEIPRDKPMAVGYSAKRRDGTRAALPRFEVRGIAPAAGYASTANDLAKFASWQLRVLAGKDENVLKARTLREMQRVHFVDPSFDTYRGLGFAIRRISDKTFVGHGGSCPGYRTNLMIQPDEKIAVVVLANASGVATDEYARVLYEIMSPAKSDSTAASADKLLPYLGSFSQFPWSGEQIFFSWGGELASVAMPTMNPVKELDRYRKTGENEFRRIRDDGSLGETLTFTMGPDGTATAFKVHSNTYPRMNP